MQSAWSSASAMRSAPWSTMAPRSRLLRATQICTTTRRPIRARVCLTSGWSAIERSSPRSISQARERSQSSLASADKIGSLRPRSCPLSWAFPSRATAWACDRSTTTCWATWTRMREIEDHGCLLVRPDRFIAWRSHSRVANPKEALRLAMQQILALISAAP